MRAILIPALAALGIALAGTSATMAAPANGEVIGQAAYANQAVQPVYWRGIAIITAGGGKRGRWAGRPAHVPAKWIPVRRQEHAPL